jgi:hypothetical protein
VDRAADAANTLRWLKIMQREIMQREIRQREIRQDNAGRKNQANTTDEITFLNRTPSETNQPNWLVESRTKRIQNIPCNNGTVARTSD